MQVKYAEKLINVFRPDSLGRLTRKNVGRQRSEIWAMLDNKTNVVKFHFSTQSRNEVIIDTMATEPIGKPPVFLPTRELLTLLPNFLSLYESYHLEFEETYRDTCLLLAAPTLRGRREETIKDILAPIEEAMGGQIVLDKTGRFYLRTKAGTMEMPLVAEGLRKYAMLARLVATGSLLDKGYLFWDEPEANLNPSLVKQLAAVILRLCMEGIQVFVATHSLFLMREFDILLKSPKYAELSSKWTSLGVTADGISITQGDSIEDMDPLVALEMEIDQSKRYIMGEEG